MFKFMIFLFEEIECHFYPLVLCEILKSTHPQTKFLLIEILKHFSKHCVLLHENKIGNETEQNENMTAICMQMILIICAYYLHFQTCYVRSRI